MINFRNYTNITGFSIASNVKLQSSSLAYLFQGKYNLRSALLHPNAVDISKTFYNCYQLTSPVISEELKSAQMAFYNCTNLADSPICPESVKDMAGMYYNCTKLSGQPICGNNVTNMSQAYYNCRQLTGQPVCGGDVIDMSQAYYDCRNITGEAACGRNVTNMFSAYMNCKNITQATCGAKVVNMKNAFSGCSKLTGEAVCGEKVQDFSGAYYYTNVNKAVVGKNVTNMSGSYYCALPINVAVCGDKVTDFSRAYACTNVVEAICGPNVTNMCNSFFRCSNLTSATCGDNVVDMSWTYYQCTNLTAAVCGPNVTNMRNAYNGCTKITEAVCGNNVTDFSGAFAGTAVANPVCGDNVTDMSLAYASCKQITKPICGPNVTNMASAYSGCTGITEAVIGENVTDMSRAYQGCSNITEGICGPNVLIMNFAYASCSNIKHGTIGATVTSGNMSYVFNNCANLTSVDFEDGIKAIGVLVIGNCPNVTQVNIPLSARSFGAGYKFAPDCPNLSRIKFVPSKFANTLPVAGAVFNSVNSTGVIEIPASLYETRNSVSTGWGNSKVVPSTDFEVLTLGDSEHYMDIDSNDLTFEFEVYNASEDLAIDFNLGQLEGALELEHQIEKVNDLKSKITVTAKQLNIIASDNLVCTITSGENTITKEIPFSIVEHLQGTYTVTDYASWNSGGSFVYDASTGYYTRSASGYYYAVSKIDIENLGEDVVYIDCIHQDGSYSYFGALSKVDTVPPINYYPDTVEEESTLFYDFENISSSQVIPVCYGQLKRGSIYVKLASWGYNAPTVKMSFRVRFEKPDSSVVNE